MAAFEAIDDNDDGVLTKEEFRKGYALLTSDSARAAAERESTAAGDLEAERMKRRRLEEDVGAMRSRGAGTVALEESQAELKLYRGMVSCNICNKKTMMV